MLAHRVLERRARCPTVHQTTDQTPGIDALGGAERVGVPFGGFEVGGGDEGGLSAHRQAHIAPIQRAIDVRAARQDFLPLGFGIGFGDARGFPDAPHRHFEPEFDLGFFHHAGDRRGGDRVRAGGERDMPLSAQQAGGRVEADPTGARQIDFGPGMQVGEIGFGTSRAIQRFHVGGQLDQIAGDETRREAEVAQDLHQQPGGVAAGALGGAQGFLGRQHARFHAHDIGDAIEYPCV